MRPTIRRSVLRPPADDVAVLRDAGVATVHEASGRQGLMVPELRPRLPRRRVAGPAVTALCAAGDNLMVHVALELCCPGDVLVIATTSNSQHGMVGELIAVQCRTRGIAGLVVDAGVRDVAQLAEVGVPVWSRVVSAAGTTKNSAGWVNVPVVCGGACVGPGDVVVADDDGVMVVPRPEAGAVAAAASARMAREEAVRPRYAAGELSLDVNDLRTVVVTLGMTYENES